jgi:hypothetical protein
MTNQSHRCSNCGQSLTQVGQFWICPDHGQVSPEQPFVPMRIFLSYGHDGNEELVLRIGADLKNRGHDVWIDKSEIKFGDDWRRSITDGIVRSNRLSAADVAVSVLPRTAMPLRHTCITLWHTCDGCPPSPLRRFGES